MYKVFFNDNIILFSKDPLKLEDIKNGMYVKFENDINLSSLALKYQSGTKNSNFTIYSPEIEKVFTSFCSKFTLVTAAGGIILNSKNQFLGIYRRGKWDLPKGKVDKNETIENAALRECTEETSLRSLELGEKIAETYHTYVEKGNILKKTVWFQIKLTSDEAAIPQMEEDITKTKWFDKYSIDEFLDNTYESIREVIHTLPFINSWNF